MSEKQTGYLHGYTTEEQERLYQQARFLEHRVYENIDLRDRKRLLEIGSGVGAQTEILLERFPHLEIFCLDAAPEQIKQATSHLKRAVERGRVHIELGDASKLKYDENTFDSAFVCWFLEHVNQPLEILKEIRRVLSPNAILYCTEVLNATFYLHPYSPATLQYWFAFNDHQWNLGGDPFVGAKLGNYLKTAGFEKISTQVMNYWLDNRSPKLRTQMFEYWTRLLLSGTPQLLEAKKVSQDLVKAMTEELNVLKNAPDSVFFYSAVQASAMAF